MNLFAGVTNAKSPVVRLRDLIRNFEQAGNLVQVLKGLSFEVYPGEFVAVQGSSGSGKSTLLQILGLLDRASSGLYELLGRDVSRLDDDELSALRADTTGFVFQNFYLIPYATALENVLLPGLYSGKSQKRARERAEFLLESVGLGDRRDFLPARLSGGQQQRVAMARALFNEPALILADEPTGQLDSGTSSDILDLLGRFNREGQTIIMVTHDSQTASRAGRRILITDGIIESDELL
ncbi:MAG: ABC transporter ATP-binding protein [Deltaproteobacteria bacterium]|jgi:putative ABC transport system ATP-binding protein|nr:ABC transporter ATP-binding protein [Deltaproteobacteria bacterium]